MNLYEMLLNLINNKMYKEKDIIERLNTFYAYNQITKDEYEKLMIRVKEVYVEKDKH